MSVKLLTEHHSEFLSLKGGCTGSSVSTLVKIPHCWKSHDEAQLLMSYKRMTLSTKEHQHCTNSLVETDVFFGFNASNATNYEMFISLPTSVVC